MSSIAEHAPRRVLYGRKRGRRLRPGRKALLEEALPRLGLALPDPHLLLEPRAVFDRAPEEVWLEVGFGAGEHLAAQAEAHPRVGLIGCESYINGVAGLIKLVAEKGLENVRIFADDARALINALESASIGRVFVLFPDPWPKTRHEKRRFVSAPTLDGLARVLEDGAEFRLATDDPLYCRWTLAHVLRNPGFEWPARRPRDWRRRPDDWPATRYEAKSVAEGRPGYYLTFRRRPR